MCYAYLGTAHFEPKNTLRRAQDMPLQLVSQVCFALRAVGITNDYEYRELHEFFSWLYLCNPANSCIFVFSHASNLPS